jgi:hypothetical protein
MSPNVPTEAARLAYSVTTGWTALSTFYPPEMLPGWAGVTADPLRFSRSVRSTQQWFGGLL